MDVSQAAEASFRRVEASMSEEDVKSYKSALGLFKGGLSKEEVAHYYDEWVQDGTYEQDTDKTRYTGPECCAKAMAKYFSETSRLTARILDVAAGTGLVGQEMYDLGFRNIDGLDPSAGMLERAGERGVYTQLYEEYIGNGCSVPVDDDAYDGITVSGGFLQGHIPCSGLHEMIRVVKTGGMICIVLREEYFDDVPEYKGRLLPLISQLETQGQWKQVAKDKIDNYYFGKSGVVFQFRVL